MMTVTTTEKQEAQRQLGFLQYLTVDNAKALFYISVALRNFAEFAKLIIGS